MIFKRTNKITTTVFLYYYCCCCCCFKWSDALLHSRETSTTTLTRYSYISIHSLNTRTISNGISSKSIGGTSSSSSIFSSRPSTILTDIHHRLRHRSRHSRHRNRNRHCHPSPHPPLSTSSTLNHKLHAGNKSQNENTNPLLLHSTMGAAEFDPDTNRKRIQRPKPFQNDVEMEIQLEKTKQQQNTPLVESLPERHAVQPHNPTPKIIILGSTGQIGRHVIKNLMSIQQEIQIVAFVRDYDKACDVLYEELIRENGSRSRGQPTLQLIVMDLVPKSDIAGYNPKDELDTKNGNGLEDDDDDEEEYAVSAARFYNDNVEDYDFRSKDDDKNYFIDPYQPLYDAMKNATAVISTIGTIRETIPFGDYIMKPWRIFLRPDKWCKDPSHPYYVNYMVMKKVLDCAEREQLKRDQQWKIWNELNPNDEDFDEEEGEKEKEDDNNSTIPVSYFDVETEMQQEKQTQKNKQGDKIRIIRISDLCVANPPWNFVTVLTNIIRSLVFRSQERCEKLLQKSELVDTIVLRPGDLIDDVRDETKTSLQVDIDGYLPSPCYVGREDVAQLATLAAISKLDPPQKKREDDKQAKQVKNVIHDEKDGKKTQSTVKQKKSKNTGAETGELGNKEAKHWNIAMGWTDSTNKYVTSTVTKSNKLIKSTSKHKSIQKALQFIAVKERNRYKLEEKKHELRNANPFYRTVIGPIRKRMTLYELQQTKPYGIFVLLPMLFFVYPMICSALFSIGKRIPILEKAAVKIFSYVKPIWMMLIRNLHLGGESLRERSNQLKKLIY